MCSMKYNKDKKTNGREDYPQESEMKLSDSFVVKDDNISLELKVKIININENGQEYYKKAHP